MHLKPCRFSRVDDAVVRCDGCGQEVRYARDPSELHGQFFCGVAERDRQAAVEAWAFRESDDVPQPPATTPEHRAFIRWLGTSGGFGEHGRMIRDGAITFRWLDVTPLAGHLLGSTAARGPADKRQLARLPSPEYVEHDLIILACNAKGGAAVFHL